MNRNTISPWFASVCTAVLALGCLGITLWQGGRMLAGLTTWDESGLKLVQAQLGVLFFGVFAYAAWKQHCDEEADSGVAVALWLLLLPATVVVAPATTGAAGAAGLGSMEFVYRKPHLCRFRHCGHGAYC